MSGCKPSGVTDFFKAIAAVAGAIVAVIALANALGFPPKPGPTPPPANPVVTLAPADVGPVGPVGPADVGGTTRAVPDVVGLDTSEAINRLQDDGFQWRSGGFEDSTTIEFGAVTRTDPPAGTQITKGAPVTFFTSTGPPH